MKFLIVTGLLCFERVHMSTQRWCVYHSGKVTRPGFHGATVTLRGQHMAGQILNEECTAQSGLQWFHHRR